MKIILPILFLFGAIVTGSATATNALAIYLTDDSVDPRILAYGKGDWKQVRLAQTPLLTEADIIAYDFTNHVITLRPGAIERIPPPPVSGTPFVVVADGERIYLGVFMTSVSSLSRAVPSIVLGDYMLVACIPTETKIHVSRTYPAQLPSDAPDPRSDERIKKALGQKLL